nr:hypothetical protein [uncultured Oscillibacter sp.]
MILRWHIQRGVAVIPRSTHAERMREPFGVFDFALSPDGMAAIAAPDQRQSAFSPTGTRPWRSGSSKRWGP